ncbi:hypothetical protein HBI56_134430 [Parastagonospora nodorum]|uniref:Methyltransferase type 11 domain-containing protein n=1 Tax=Phaeosphaeria nodorum (strain SN15 / ATCC MYA-4574 / FGSC 10173) TaxID=321614 RepID=A0A7U2I331_PHANO|nr:hypothetical protein HBH56_037530 [Parastagonospora nodorum]QRC99943.1 hypothetical protein JI435_068660 [Parastagonospora nodorum SN15]KAH3933696.1 hypothetical protein HBH54_061950 [Parastagonospora nodorum]KAH3952531.1 hypothetical protein HBH53_048180 [Parastagonospora nodorum]KAH3979921.1 hypothetical protein HBH51_059180 [Parastagonospora nodorum]
MFTADLSWSGPNTETVGERRERKARERSSVAGSVTTSTSSRSSISGERELWWTSGLKKAKGIKSTILRPSSHHSTRSQTTIRSAQTNQDLQQPHSLKDPTLQPSWTYASTLSTNLPSGAPFDLPLHEVPELDGDSSSRRTNSTEARFSPQERPWEVRTPVNVDIIEEDSQYHARTSGSYHESEGRGNSFATSRDEDFITSPSPCVPAKAKRRPPPVVVDKSLEFEALRLHDSIEPAAAVAEIKSPVFSAHRSTNRAIECPPISEWESLAPRGTPQKMHVSPRSTSNKVAVAHSSTLELTRFQKFIRRMESAGPQIVLDRLKEEWQVNPGEEVDEQLALEKQLWLLTGFQMQNVRNAGVTPKPSCDTGRILELYGNLSEVFQMSAMYPRHTVHFLTNQSRRPVTLPANVSYLTVRDCGAVPLPYPENYFAHIRASTLPSLVSSSKLPELFRECYKLLAPGGLLEVRIMDAAPVRRTAGPLLRTWIDDRLSVNLERLFRCSKPCSLVPTWLADAGFDMVHSDSSSSVTLPCAIGSASTDVTKELSTVIGREMWRDVWGPFVDDVPGESRWWWEDEDIVQECLERKTVLECRAIYAYRK